jgi:hypothetical protein
MRVKLCARCPYTPRDLTGHYDPDAALHVCARCDGARGVLTRQYPRKAERRQKCSTVSNIFSMAQRNVAPSVTESLVSSDTTPGELPSAQRGAWLASNAARKATADGYADFTLPDHQLQNHAEKPEPSVPALMPVSAEDSI